jgi:hypothetical protein
MVPVTHRTLMDGPGIESGRIGAYPWQFADSLLLRSPVERVRPTIYELGEVLGIGAALPPDTEREVDPSGRGQSPAQIVQHGLVHRLRSTCIIRAVSRPAADRASPTPACN